MPYNYDPSHPFYVGNQTTPNSSTNKATRDSNKFANSSKNDVPVQTFSQNFNSVQCQKGNAGDSRNHVSNFYHQNSSASNSIHNQQGLDFSAPSSSRQSAHEYVGFQTTGYNSTSTAQETPNLLSQIPKDFNINLFPKNNVTECPDQIESNSTLNFSSVASKQTVYPSMFYKAYSKYILGKHLEERGNNEPGHSKPSSSSVNDSAVGNESCNSPIPGEPANREISLEKSVGGSCKENQTVVTVKNKIVRRTTVGLSYEERVNAFIAENSKYLTKNTDSLMTGKTGPSNKSLLTNNKSRSEKNKNNSSIGTDIPEEASRLHVAENTTNFSSMRAVKGVSNNKKMKLEREQRSDFKEVRKFEHFKRERGSVIPSHVSDQFNSEIDRWAYTPAYPKRISKSLKLESPFDDNALEAMFSEFNNEDPNAWVHRPNYPKVTTVSIEQETPLNADGNFKAAFDECKKEIPGTWEDRAADPDVTATLIKLEPTDNDITVEAVFDEFNEEVQGSWVHTPHFPKITNVSIKSEIPLSDTSEAAFDEVSDEVSSTWGRPEIDSTIIKSERLENLKTVFQEFNNEDPSSWVHKPAYPKITTASIRPETPALNAQSYDANARIGRETNVGISISSLVPANSKENVDTTTFKSAGSAIYNSENILLETENNRSPSTERKYRYLIHGQSSSISPERRSDYEDESCSQSKKNGVGRATRTCSPTASVQSNKHKSRSSTEYFSENSCRLSVSKSRSPSGSRTRLYSSDYSSTTQYSVGNKSSFIQNRSSTELKLRNYDKINNRHDRYSNNYSTKSCKQEQDASIKGCSERESLLLQYRKHFCSDINEMRQNLSKLNIEELMEKETQIWTRMSPATLYYKSTSLNAQEGTEKLKNLCDLFEDLLIKRAVRIREAQPKYEPPERRKKMKLAKHKSEHCSSSDSSSSSSSEDEEDCTMEELEKKRLHPFRLHQELWFNDFGEMNDGPLCRCSARARRSGIRHNIYAGEMNLPLCVKNSNNVNSLYHYRITISPPTNFLTKTPTIISYDDHEFIFEGFSMFSHTQLDKLPVCKVIRFNIEYTILYFEEKMLDNFTITELDLFYEYLFKEILELVDLDFKPAGDKTRCAQFHFLPRFVRELPENGKEILSMNEVLLYLLKNSEDLVKADDLEWIQRMPQYQWQKQVDFIKGMVVTIPGMKPCSLRVDQLDRDEVEGKTSSFPEIVHFGIRPPQLSYAGNPEYQKAWREYVKFRHLLANMPKPSFDDKRRLEIKETTLQDMRTQSKMKRDVTVTVSSEGFKKTGIMCDIVQHAMLIPVLVTHLRFHCSLSVLETSINYKFKNRFLLQLALTHPSYRENFGTNPDHARNSLTNCGIRQPEYGDRRIHYMNTRKRGINTLINIMSRFGKKTETESNITHNERLEFLGDAVVEFITSIHLFHMFPELEEGGLATYRAAIVQNQHLAVLAKKLKLDEFMLYAHGSDLCHDLELRHAMANCFEALMGALFLDGGIEVADKVFGETLFKDENDLLEVWVKYPPHPLQEQEPLGDRKWIPRFKLLKNLVEFEDSVGIEFTHIRLLARSFTDRSIGYTNLTLGSNQRLEFLGDTVLQLIASEYLYKYFPEHHEGHLSLLRSSLVNNRTQAVVCDDLGMTKYALYHNPKAELKTKDRADLLEAFLGALYVDKGLEYCESFCNVCFFPRLQTFIMRQDWNDPKSKLQQCCLTLRTMEGGEPEIPIYKVIECMGPTNTRVYTVAVYFKGQRLAAASGHSIQQAEMNAAKKALQYSHGLFPQLDHQKRVIAKSLKSQHGSKSNNNSLRGEKTSEFHKLQTKNYSKRYSSDSSQGCSDYKNRKTSDDFRRPSGYKNSK